MKARPIGAFVCDMRLQRRVTGDHLDSELDERDVGRLSDGRGSGAVLEHALPNEDGQGPISDGVDLALLPVGQVCVAEVSSCQTLSTHLMPAGAFVSIVRTRVVCMIRSTSSNRLSEPKRTCGIVGSMCACFA